MKIRFADQKDKVEILKLLNELTEEIKSKNPSYKSPLLNDNNQIFDEIVSRKDTMIFVAEENNQILGMASFYILPNVRHSWHRGHIEDFVVGKIFRGQGVGSKIISAIKLYCRENNIKVIKLDSDLELVNAHKFYEKNGGRFSEKMFRFDID